jgi:hypothetical protein
LGTTVAYYLEMRVLDEAREVLVGKKIRVGDDDCPARPDDSPQLLQQQEGVLPFEVLKDEEAVREVDARCSHVGKLDVLAKHIVHVARAGHPRRGHGQHLRRDVDCPQFAALGSDEARHPSDTTAEVEDHRRGVVVRAKSGVVLNGPDLQLSSSRVL